MAEDQTTTSTEVIDLTSSSSNNDDEDDEDAAAATSASTNITPDRPNKRVRMSRRLEARQQQRELLKKRSNDGTGVKYYGSTKNKGDEDVEDVDDDDDDTPQYEGKHINGYFEVDEVLDRRTRKYGSESAGLRHVVEYFVSWKIPTDFIGDKSYYDPSWLIAENLDQNSLAEAFKKFPMDADPKREDDAKLKSEEKEEDEVGHFELDDDELDFSDDEEEEEQESDEEEEELEKSSSDEMQEYEEKEDVVKDPDVSHLEDSDYDSPGTVELVLNRRTYRVGQSYFHSPSEDIIYVITMILPIPRQVRCHKYMKMDKCFVCPRGKEGNYVLMGEVTLDLPTLKLPCKHAFKKFPMKYEQEDENQRSFAYYNDTGKIQYHPTGRPTCLDMYAGAGGMSIGLNKHFDVKWVVDNDHLAAATLRANKTNEGCKIYTEDVKTFLKQSVQGNPCYPTPGEPDHIHASPPCKGFSRANRNGGKDDLLNNKQTLLFIKAVKHFRPKTVSYENVPGLVLAEYKRYLQCVVASLLQLEYQVCVKVLTSSSYGDPQKRRRLILMAARSDCRLPQTPTVTHGPGLLPIKTCKEALQMFEKYEPTSRKSSGSVLIGNNTVFNHIVPGHKVRQDEDFELIEDQPSRTILAKARPHCHYNGKRYISVREAACIQSFPISYQFFGSLANQYSQVGNAVPVALASAIARSVAVSHGCAV